MSIEQWLAKAELLLPTKNGARRETTFAPLAKEPLLDSVKHEVPSHPTSILRSLRYLPYSQRTFRHICERFQVHKSVVRTLARSDVPTFSCDDVEMGEPALGKARDALQNS